MAFPSWLKWVVIIAALAIVVAFFWNSYVVMRATQTPAQPLRG